MAQLVTTWASAPVAWVWPQLSARGFPDASTRQGGFTCLRTRLSPALKSSRAEITASTLRTNTDGNESWDLSRKTRVVISTIKRPIHTYIPKSLRNDWQWQNASTRIALLKQSILYNLKVETQNWIFLSSNNRIKTMAIIGPVGEWWSKSHENKLYHRHY